MPKKRTKAKKDAWFVPVRWSYLPVSSEGWLLYIPYLSYLVATYVAVARSSDSVITTILGVIPCWVAGAVVIHWIASHKS